MEKTKITKREMFEAIKTGATTGEWTISDVELVEFCDKEIELLDKKSAKAKEAAAKRKTEGDALSAVVKAALTDELQTIATITEKVVETDAEATVHKVQYRLSQLEKNGAAVKAKISVGGEDGEKKREVVAYKLA
jgi:hypothetical protein